MLSVLLLGISSPCAAGFVFVLDLLDCILRQVRYLLCVFDAQSEPLGFSPAGKPLFYFTFMPLFAGLVEVGAK